ncbi:MAG: AAA family ATPase [Acutalibacteraceae bacterium]
MPKVFLIGGKLCCGKTTYAEKLIAEHKAVLLSCDEIMLSLFNVQAGEKHDETVAKVKQYLLAKSLEIINAGGSVILDWGFWTKAERDFTKEYYRKNGVNFEFHYIEVSDEVWRKRIQMRNASVLAGDTGAYFVDESLAAKFEKVFETPGKNEIDFFVE